MVHTLHITVKKVRLPFGTILFGATIAKETSCLLGETSISQRVVNIAKT
jgi:hypothetical protein